MGTRVGLAATLLWLSLWGAPVSADETTTARVFQLHHRSVIEATQVIQQLLSEDGTLTFHPQGALLTVQDHPEVVERIAAVLADFDREPAGYRLRVDLLEGLRDAGAATGETVDVAAKVQRMFPFSAYQRLASAVVEGRVGARGGVELGESFTLRFYAGSANLISAGGMGRELTPGRGGPGARPSTAREPLAGSGRKDVQKPDPNTSITALGSRFRLQQLTLLKRQEGEDGAEEMVEVFRSNVTMAPGQSIVVGASASEDSERALVLIIEAESVEEK